MKHVATIILLFAFSALILSAQENQTYEPGFDIDVYWIGKDIKFLPELVPGQTPNIDVRADTLDMSGPSKTPEFDSQFLTISRARLTIKEAGEYVFRLTSDDGSALYLDKKMILDHDGLHGSTAREARLKLEPGAYPIEVRHFENLGGWRITLEWRRPGQKEFELLDRDYVSTPKGVVRVTSPGKKRVKKRVYATAQGDGRPLTSIHPGYKLATLRPEGFKPKIGGIDFLKGGRMVVCCWEPSGKVYILDGVQDADPKKVTLKEIASGLAEPLGIKVVGDRLFVLQKQELTELIDHDGDEVIDEYRCVSDDWTVSSNFHEFSFGLVEKDGWLYLNLAIAINPGGASTNPQVENRGRTVRVNIETGKTEFLTYGLRTPNGIGKGPGGEIFITDNQGDWLPSSKLLILKEGAFYGQRAALPKDWDPKTPVTPPVVWLPQNEIGNSPAEPTLFLNGPFMGQMAVCDVTHGGIKRVFIEKVGDTYQGAVFRFTQGLEAGINRMKILAGGSIFVGGIGSGGNWGQDGKLWYGLQRLVPDGQKTFEMHGIRVAKNGFNIDFTEKLGYGMGTRVEDYTVESFRYEATAAYGGPKIDLRQEEVSQVHVWKNRRRAFIAVSKMEAGRIYYLRLSPHIRSENHRALWTTEAWYTLNKLPKRTMPVPATEFVDPPHNLLLNKEKKQGWKMLFDGKSAEHFRGFKSDKLPDKGWQVIDGALCHLKGEGGGDIITKEQFGDFEFQCEWQISENGNSGIIYRVNELGHSTWASGPEMQVLDDARLVDSTAPYHRAGSLYEFIACKKDAVRPTGEWNHARIVFKDDQVEHWLNGILVVQYRWSKGWFRDQIAKTKFAGEPYFAKAKRGHIALQDHGDTVKYRNIKVRPLN
ncbi:MAG: cytochrome c [Planctomycetota bacterium]|jgi:cytochrome c